MKDKENSKFLWSCFNTATKAGSTHEQQLIGVIAFVGLMLDGLRFTISHFEKLK